MRRIFSLVIGLLFIANICQAGCDFDGVDDAVSCGTSDTLNIFNSNMTFSCWMYSASTTADQCLFQRLDWRAGADNEGYGFYFGRFNDARLGYAFFNNGGDSGFSNTNLSTNTWYHICITFNSSTKVVSFFVNGSSHGTDTSIVVPASNSGDLAQIGLEISGYPYSGVLNEVAIWNVVLSAPEIAQLANSRIKGMPLQIQPSSLKGYWPMDDQEHGTSADGDTVTDLSGNNNKGVGDNGANNVGLTWQGEGVLSYPE